MAEEVVGEAHKIFIPSVNFQVLQRWGGVAEGEGGGVGVIVFVDNQGFRPCDMGNEVVDHVELSGIYGDVDGCWLRPLEVRKCTVGVHDCAVETVAVSKQETGPEGRAGYEGRPPIPTDMRGLDQIALAGAIFENPGQDLWWKPVGRDRRVPDRPNRLQNRGEITFDAMDLWTMRRLATDYIRILGHQTFWGCKSSRFLRNEVNT